MIGTKKVRNRAYHKLQCRKTGASTWLVWGGESEHVVTSLGDGNFSCDCKWGARTGGTCSHKARVGIEIVPDLFISDLVPTGGKAPSYKKVKGILKYHGYAAGELDRYQDAVAVAVTHKKYTVEIQEQIAAMVYRFLKGKQS